MGELGRIFDPTQNILSPIFNPVDEPSVPTPPNPSDTIAQQKQAQQIFQITPQGTIEYGTIGANGEFIPRTGADAMKVTESEFQKQFRTGQEGIALGLVDQLNQPLSGYNPASGVSSNIGLQGDFSGDIARLEDQTYEAGKRRLDPQFQQSRESLIQNLADRGIPLSSEAAQRELDRFDQSQSDAYQDLTFRSIESGRAEQDRLARLGASLRGQDINEQLAISNLGQQQRAQQFGEIGALGGFSAPFQPLNAPTVDVAGIINQSYANQLGASQQAGKNYANSQALFGDFASLAGTAAVFSDLRLKENIKYHSTKNDYKLYEFNYKGGDIRYRGVMAQDILEQNPEAVTIMDNGFYGVFYNKLGLEMEVV